MTRTEKTAWTHLRWILVSVDTCGVDIWLRLVRYVSLIHDAEKQLHIAKLKRHGEWEYYIKFAEN